MLETVRLSAVFCSLGIGLPGIVLPAGYDEQGVPFSICYSGLRGYDYTFKNVLKLL